ncbi:hypothetical protein N6B72_10765 [Chryseobacterium soli]|uniref:hypothetical protein n=1 Tax=Chryseobacterium soli TaxID=445961 RepID=UPI002954F191|nr:hypothetical protein [Chryseobacterium soli]MDV7697403.1 hypothetical protein [Chryseobacterium soli]
MKNLFLGLLVVVSGFYHAQYSGKTQIYILGTVHEPSTILNPQMLFEILNTIQPDVILQELDSEQMKDFQKESMSKNSNEVSAALLYSKKYPKTLNLPFEFEGRNQYRKDNGMVPTDNLTIKLMDSLYKKNALSPVNTIIYEKYQQANTALKDFAQSDIKTLNSLTFESVNRYRQFVQHHEIPKISNSEEIFARNFVVKPNGEKISYRDGYQLWCNFWDLRNNTMSLNIIKKANEYKGKKIVILTGVQHKYYLKELLDKYNDGNYTVVEYFK